jgi:hypothetical protein
MEILLERKPVIEKLQAAKVLLVTVSKSFHSLFFHVVRCTQAATFSRSDFCLKPFNNVNCF